MLFTLAATAADEKPGVVTVMSVKGEAQYSVDGGHTWIPVLAGKALGAGSLLQSGDRTIVDVLIGQSYADKSAQAFKFDTKLNPARNVLPQLDRNTIRLRPNTVLGIEKLSVSAADATLVSDAELNLKKGRIFASIQKVSPSSVYLVKIPDGVAAVRGTSLSLDTDGGNNTSCSVSSGTVWMSFTVTDANGNPVTDSSGNAVPAVTVSVTPGQSFSLSSSLITQIAAQVTAAGGNASAAAVLQTVTALANAGISELSSGQVGTLASAIGSLTTPTFTPGVAPSAGSDPSNPNSGTPTGGTGGGAGGTTGGGDGGGGVSPQ